MTPPHRTPSPFLVLHMTPLGHTPSPEAINTHYQYPLPQISAILCSLSCFIQVARVTVNKHIQVKLTKKAT